MPLDNVIGGRAGMIVHACIGQMKKTEANGTQRIYARLAGGLFVGAILVAFGGGSVVSRIAGNGNLRGNSSKDCSIGTVIPSGTLKCGDLGFKQRSARHWTVCNPEVSQQVPGPNRDDFNLADSFVALVVRMCGFVRLHLYLTARASTGAGLINVESLNDLVRSLANTT